MRLASSTQNMNLYSYLGWWTAGLVYQEPDWPWFIKTIELNPSSIYGDLVIAPAKSTP
jgi:hypothetical protein